MNNPYTDLSQQRFFNWWNIAGLLMLSISMLWLFYVNQKNSINLTAEYFGGDREGLENSISLAIATMAALSIISFAPNKIIKIIAATGFAILFCYGVFTIIQQNEKTSYLANYKPENDSAYLALKNQTDFIKNQLIIEQKNLNRLLDREEEINRNYMFEVSNKNGSCLKKKTTTKRNHCTAWEGTQKKKRLKQNSLLITAQQNKIAELQNQYNKKAEQAKNTLDNLTTQKKTGLKEQLLNPYIILSGLKYDALANLAFSALLFFLSKAISLIFLNMNLGKKMEGTSEEVKKNHELRLKLTSDQHLQQLKQAYLKGDKSYPVSMNALQKRYRGILNDEQLEEAREYGLKANMLGLRKLGNGRNYFWIDHDKYQKTNNKPLLKEVA